MALLHFDGFDGYDAAADLTNFGGWHTASDITFSATVRTGSGKSILLGATNGALRGVFAAAQTGKTLYCGFAFNFTSVGGGAGTSASLFTLFETIAATNPQLSVKIDKDTSKLQIVRGSTVLATGTTVLSVGTWRYVEIMMLIHASAGACEVKLDGISEVSVSAVNTSNAATTAVPYFGWGFSTTGYAVAGYYDDMYILNADGAANNTYLGEQRCQIMTPTSDSTVAWTRNTGASNFSAVDDTIGAPDDDTTYVSSSTSTQKDEYGLSDITTVGAVAGVKLVTRAEKDDANPLSFKAGIKSGATDQQITHTLGVGYANFIDLFETSDGASTAFTQTTVNSLLSTIEVV
jgi:hypothetical protein